MIDELRRPRTTAPALQRMITDRWRCTVCLGKSGSDAVVLHHDHIECYVSWLMADTSRLPGPAIELKPVHDFNLLSEFITTVRGFPPTLICHSCNELDGTNLKQRGAHVYFSLSATDLSAIYCGENEGGRARSFDLAFALWRRRAAAYGARLVEIAWLLRDHLAQARWQREPAGRCSEAADMMLRSASANWRLVEWDDGQEQPDMKDALQHASLDNGERYCQIRSGAGIVKPSLLVRAPSPQAQV